MASISGRRLRSLVAGCFRWVFGGGLLRELLWIFRGEQLDLATPPSASAPEAFRFSLAWILRPEELTPREQGEVEGPHLSPGWIFQREVLGPAAEVEPHRGVDLGWLFRREALTPPERPDSHQHGGFFPLWVLSRDTLEPEDPPLPSPRWGETNFEEDGETS